MQRRAIAVHSSSSLAATVVAAQQNRIDTVTPTAPELAPYGPHDIGVRTIQVTDKNRPDILNIKEGGPIVRYDRTLTLEVWYPASARGWTETRRRVSRHHARPRGDGDALRQGGSRCRSAQGRRSRYPLVIISHGYPGNRFLMSHIGENLASKGFVTVSIDHKDSTYDDQKAFGSTLYNRPFDQLFVLNEIDRLSKAGSGSFLAGLVDATRAGIIGYSMGGYGVVNVIGGGYSAASATFSNAPPNKMLAERGAANPEYQKARDPRIKAAIAIGPWGMQADSGMPRD